MSEKNQKFPNAIEAVIVLLAFTALKFVLGMALYAMRATLGLDPMELAGMAILLASAITFTCVMEYKALSYRALFHAVESRCGPALPLIVPAILLTVPALVLLVGALLRVVVGLFPLSADDAAMFEQMGAGGVGVILITCLLAPVLEEMLFRGIVLRSFLLQYPRWTSIAGSAFLFGAAHMNVYQFAAAFVLGTCLGWLYERAQSLIPCIALHAAYNTLLLTLHLTRNEQIERSLTSGATALVGTALLLGGAGVVLLRRALPAGR